ncbi:hypothetical protein [Bacillus cereus]|uniref:hypothetical protein n=1 Tax=Bacillus cereus TaxID=1396 RepID=UPI0006990497|nr:hypothetical protein [Bacillus cereus]
MRKDEYPKENMFVHTENEMPFKQEESPDLSSHIRTSAKDVNRHVSFCTVIEIPSGFEFVKHGKAKIVYNLDYLNVIRQTSMKTVHVDEVGSASVKLNFLKIVGYIPYLVNAEVKGKWGEQHEASFEPQNHIYICGYGNIDIDSVLKVSVDHLPDYQVEGQHVRVSALHVTPFYEQKCTLLRFEGTLTFEYDSDE